MYEIIYAPVFGHFPLDWAVWDIFPSVDKACEQLADEIKKDIANGDTFTYRIVPAGEW